MNIGRFTQLKQWLGALHPKVYGHILPALQKKYGRADRGQ